MNPLIIGGVVIGLFALWMVAPEIVKQMQHAGLFGVQGGLDISGSDQGSPSVQRTGQEAIAELESRGLWSPSVPISERPEEQTLIKTKGGLLVAP